MRPLLALLLLASTSCSFPEYTEQAPMAVETCRDGLLSQGELAIDCGPMCSASCEMGQTCTAHTECTSGLCEQGKCGIASCSDNVRNQTETDVDCGGADGCAPCATDKRCESDYDCNVAKCNAGFCQAQGCSDDLKNQDESDTDCGGSCDQCQPKQHCNSSDDCLNSQCSQGLCQPQSCDDGVENGDETGQDCGGSCIPCPDSSHCLVAEDCVSQSCSAGICLVATCQDGILNGSESSLDCGGSCSAEGKACGMTETCKLNADCQSGKCEATRCVPATTTGVALSTAGWIASASATFKESVPAKAIDGNTGSFWESGSGQLPGMWFQIDMLKPQAFFALELVCNTNGDYPRSLRVVVSEDGQNFSAATATLNGEKSMRFDFAAAKIARYVKFEIQQDSGGLWWRIDELRVLQ